jgi:LCP family protein required for cell wall assembly
MMLFSLLLGTMLGSFYFSSPTLRDTVSIWMRGGLSVDKAFPNEKEMNILLLGKDEDRDHHGQVVKTNARTDTIILAHFDFERKTANLLSIPRDTKVKIPGYRGKHKINAAHAYGGPELTMETITRFLNVQPDRYMVIDYNGFKEAINRLGGLEVTVDKELNYDDNWGNLHIHLKPGRQVLNGEQAMGFVRFRKSNDGVAVSDTERIQRQQQFLYATKAKLVNPWNFRKLPSVIEDVRGNMHGSLSTQQMLALANFVKNLPSQNVNMATLPSTEGRVYVTADEDAAQRLVNQMFY